MAADSWCCDCCTKTVTRRSAIGVFLVAVAMAAIGMWLPPFIRHKIDQTLTDKATITPDAQAANTDAYRVWADNTQPDAPPYWYRVSLFHCNNPSEVIAGAKPNLTEIGPFVYREYTVRLNVTFSADEYGRQIVSFRKWQYYVFDAAASNGLDDGMVITTLRMPFQGLKQSYMAMLYHGRGAPRPNEYNNNTQWTDEMRLFDTHSVRDFLFGYADPQIQVAGSQFNACPYPYGGTVGNVSTIEQALQLPFHAHFTGLTPHEQLMRSYVQYNNMTYLNFSLAPSRDNAFAPLPPYPQQPLWGTTAANRVYGSDGDQFPMHLQPGQSLAAWVDDLHREVDLINYDNETYTYDGIELYRFRLSERTMQNVTGEPGNAAYYQFTTPNGMLNNTFVEPGAAEIYFSKPHFLGVDPEIASRVDGLLPPDPERDMTYIDVEPISGITMHAFKRLQINAYVHPYNYTKPKDLVYAFEFPWADEVWLPHVRHTFWPLFWVEEGGVIPDSDAAQFVRGVYGGRKLATVLEFVGYIGGAVAMVVATALLFKSQGMAERIEEEVEVDEDGVVAEADDSAAPRRNKPNAANDGYAPAEH